MRYQKYKTQSKKPNKNHNKKTFSQKTTLEEKNLPKTKRPPYENLRPLKINSLPICKYNYNLNVDTHMMA